MTDTRAIARIKAEAAALNRLGTRHELVAGSVPNGSATCSCGRTFTADTLALAIAAHVAHAVAALRP